MNFKDRGPGKERRRRNMERTMGADEIKREKERKRKECDFALEHSL